MKLYQTMGSLCLKPLHVGARCRVPGASPGSSPIAVWSWMATPHACPRESVRGQAGCHFCSTPLCNCYLGMQVGRRETNRLTTVSSIRKFQNQDRFFFFHVAPQKRGLLAFYYSHFGKAVFFPQHLCLKLILCYFLPTGLCWVPWGTAFSNTKQERQ